MLAYLWRALGSIPDSRIQKCAADTGTICSKLVSLRCCWQRPQHMRALNYRKLNHGSLHWELGAWLTTLALTEHTLELLEMNVVRMKRH